MNPTGVRIYTQWRPERASYQFTVLIDGFRPGNDAGDGFELGVMSVARPMEFETLGRHGILRDSEPTLELPEELGRDFLQAAMDEAWRMGLRPSGVKDLEGTLSATRYHLEDMRELNKLKRSDS